jgi:hypothetical protein
MPDITKCNNTECKFKENCYRFTSLPSMMQSISTFTPNETNCDYYINNQNYDNQRIKVTR